MALDPNAVGPAVIRDGCIVRDGDINRLVPQQRGQGNVLGGVNIRGAGRNPPDPQRQGQGNELGRANQAAGNANNNPNVGANPQGGCCGRVYAWFRDHSNLIIRCTLLVLAMVVMGVASSLLSGLILGAAASLAVSAPILYTLIQTGVGVTFGVISLVAGYLLNEHLAQAYPHPQPPAAAQG